MTAPFRPANPGLCKLGLALAGFMQLLDTTIANVSLPTIAGNLGATTEQAAWVITSFGVCNAIVVPLSGWLVRRFGEVRLFLAATMLFTVASILCGLAANIGMLTAARALQGFVAGPITPVTQGLMISLFPENRRTQAIAMVTAVTIVAPIVGPILGGWITDNFSWPWIFFINIPVGIFACSVVWGQMRKKPEQTQHAPMDYTGLMLLALGVGALQILLDMGNDEDWFESAFIIGAAAVSAVSLAAFLIWSLTGKQPIIDLHLFRNYNFTVGTITMALATGAFMSTLVLIPMWMQTQLHYPATLAGMAQAPSGLFPVLLMPLVGKYAHRADLRVLTTIGVAILGFSMFLRSYFTLDVDFVTIASVQLLQGLGLSLFMVCSTSIMLSHLKPHEISSATGLSVCLRLLSGSFFVSISQYQWHHRTILHHAQLAEPFVPGSAATAAATNMLGNGDTQAAMAVLDRMVTAQAFQISFGEMFYAMSILFVCLAMLVWLTRPPFERAGAPAKR